ncbi:substance-K receptor-like [Acropora muricata]|uniref:substance-K receptor-like n=1 Tax=Acropora muricata TaxID=159855 RepID=UPI0034E5B399
MNNSPIDDLPKCPQVVSAVIVSSISFLSIASFLGNSMIIITFLQTSTLRTSVNYLIVNMAISDLISAATNWPLASTEGLLSTTLVIGGSTATIVCKTGLYSRAISQAVSVESLLLIVVERYIAIARPFQSVLITRRLRITLVSSTWIFALLVTFPYVWTSQIIEDENEADCRTFVKWTEIEKSVFYGVGFIIFYVVPLVVTIVLYSRIIRSLNQSRHTLEGEQPDQQKLRRAHQQNRAVMKIFLLIVSAFFICWTPLCVYIVLKKTFPASLFPTNSCQVYVVMFFYLFPSLGTVANPVILFLSSTRFSAAFKKMFNCFTRNSSLCCQSRRVAPDLAIP